MGGANLNCFIVSSKMHSILKEFNLQEHQWANCTIRKKDKTWNYHLLRFAQPHDKKKRPLPHCPEMVDWENSVFLKASERRHARSAPNTIQAERSMVD